MYIILEYYLLENFLINFLVLYSTNRITKSYVKIKKIIIGSIFATSYALIVFLPSLLFLSSFLFKVLISGSIVYITFKSSNIKTFSYQFFSFYIVSFIFAGAIISLSSSFTNMNEFLTKEINLFNIFTIKHISSGIIIAIFISLIVFTYNHRKKDMEKFIVDAKIIYQEKISTFKALVDTGNTLKDPLSNRSVFVVELSKILNLLPEELVDYYNSPKKYNIEDLLINLNDKFPLALVPFKSIGNDSGIILGFKPDKVLIKAQDKDDLISLDKIIIGIYQGSLSDDTDFSGLLNYETIVQKEEIWLN